MGAGHAAPARAATEGKGISPPRGAAGEQASQQAGLSPPAARGGPSPREKTEKSTTALLRPGAALQGEAPQRRLRASKRGSCHTGGNRGSWGLITPPMAPTTDMAPAPGIVQGPCPAVSGDGPALRAGLRVALAYPRILLMRSTPRRQGGPKAGDTNRPHAFSCLGKTPPSVSRQKRTLVTAAG